MENFIILLLI